MMSSALYKLRRSLLCSVFISACLTAGQKLYVLLYFSILLHCGIIFRSKYSVYNVTKSTFYKKDSGLINNKICLFRPHMGHHQGNFIIGETTALYTLSSVPLGTSLFLLLISFVVYFYRIFLMAISVFFMSFYFCYACFSVVFLCTPCSCS
jgi:hypothetical protein